MTTPGGIPWPVWLVCVTVACGGGKEPPRQDSSSAERVADAPVSAAATPGGSTQVAGAQPAVRPRRTATDTPITGLPRGAEATQEPQVVGTVGIVGLVPGERVVVQTDDRRIEVTGSLLGELRRLQNARVALYGTIVEGAPWASISPERYDVISVDGTTPFVGILEAAGDEVILRGEAEWLLEGAPLSLRRQLGAKVLVQGDTVGGRLRVITFAVLRDPSP